MEHVVILAGGKGTRLGTLVSDTPKALVNIGPHTILEHQINHLKKHGFENINLSLGHLADKVIDYFGDRYRYFVEKTPLGTGGALKMIAKDLRGHLLVLSGDIYSDVNFRRVMDAHLKHKNDITLIIIYELNSELIHEVALDGERIVSYNPFPKEIKVCFHTTGFYVVKSQILKDVTPDKFSIELDVFTKAVKTHKVGYYLHEGVWFDIGTPDRLSKVRSYVLQNSK